MKRHSFPVFPIPQKQVDALRPVWQVFVTAVHRLSASRGARLRLSG